MSHAGKQVWQEASHWGEHVVLGGKVGVADHRSIGDFVFVAAMSGVSKNLPSNATYGAKRRIREQSSETASDSNLEVRQFAVRNHHQWRRKCGNRDCTSLSKKSKLTERARPISAYLRSVQGYLVNL
eukprot:TRINITY_DN3028_c0_g1_i6.p1 TRINITY_DN3028_c0_g1~~TRINITY_DN3028_c0_g1_i6.p1  ORF type:complete len:127 (+),score=8.99 TRINITY_DN3028_c0_g1_i6:324-704(+)